MGVEQSMKHLILCFIAGLLLTACAAKDKPPKTAEFYFQQGEEYLEEGLYDNAIASWEKVRESYYSPELTMLAEMKIAETYYAAERYPEAASAYEDYIRQYPGDPRRASATYWLAMSYYHQILDYDRDQTNTKNALNAFNDLLRLYPDEKDESEIRPLIQRCKNQLAAHEVYVGRFYLRTKHYQSAINRLEEIPQQYPGYSHLDEVYFYLISAHVKLEDHQKAQGLFQRLQSTFPNSPFIEKAEKKLRK